MFKKQKARYLSGALAVLISCSTIINSGSTVWAAETSQPEIRTESMETGKTDQKENVPLPLFEEVKEQLDQDEVVTAEDFIVTSDMKYDVTLDLTKINYNKDKVNVKFKEITNEKKANFDQKQPGTYCAVYEVYPHNQKHPAYQISRNIVIEKDSKAAQPEQQANNKEESDDASDSDSVGPIEEVQQKEIDIPADAESIEITEAEAGVFLSVAPTSAILQRGQNVTLERGKLLYYPENLGNYVTNIFWVNGKIAYCLESQKATPPDSDYVAEVLNGNENVQKCLYYGYGGPGDLTNTYMPSFDDDTKFIFTHIAASYAYTGMGAFQGCTMEDLEACGVLGYIDFLFNQPNPPVAAIDFSSTYEEAYLENDTQRTKEMQLVGDYRNYVTLNLPSNVTYHDVTNGTEVTGGSTTINGDGRFYFTAPKTITGTWDTGELKGQIGSQWKTLVLSTGSSTQDIGYGDFITDEANSVGFQIKWLDIAKIELTKKDNVSNIDLSGAIFGIYSDEACTNLIAQMPATNSTLYACVLS